MKHTFIITALLLISAAGLQAAGNSLKGMWLTEKVVVGEKTENFDLADNAKFMFWQFNGEGTGRLIASMEDKGLDIEVDWKEIDGELKMSEKGKDRFDTVKVTYNTDGIHVVLGKEEGPNFHLIRTNVKKEAKPQTSPSPSVQPESAPSPPAPSPKTDYRGGERLK